MAECKSVWIDSLLQWVSLRRNGKLDLVGILQICEVKGCFEQRGQMEKVDRGLHDRTCSNMKVRSTIGIVKVNESHRWSTRHNR